MFINPMWDHETQRIGKLKCSKWAYALHVVSDLIGFASLLGFVFGMISLLNLQWQSSLLCLCVSVFTAISGNLLHGYSWFLVEQKGFQYDHVRCTASWIDGKTEVIYQHNNQDP